MMWLAALGMTSGDEIALRAHEIVLKTSAAIESRFWDPKRKLYVENEPKGQPCFNWGAGVMLSALNATQNSKRTQEWWPVLQSYWNPRGPVPGYDVSPRPQGVDRYYDDNAWMAIALFEAGKKEWGIKALDYALSGWDEQLGGGVFWREKERNSKNTCSNSPVSYACFVAYRQTGKLAYKDKGFAILDWTLKNLMDPSDHLMWDNIHLNGKVEQTKWSYNTGLTIRAIAEAERLGHTSSVTPKQMWDSAWKHWKTPGGIACEGKFAHLLVEAGLAECFLTAEDQKYVLDVLDHLGTSTNWLYGHRWDRPRGEHEKPQLIDSASVVRIAALLARTADGSLPKNHF